MALDWFLASMAMVHRYNLLNEAEFDGIDGYNFTLATQIKYVF